MRNRSFPVLAAFSCLLLAVVQAAQRDTDLRELLEAMRVLDDKKIAARSTLESYPRIIEFEFLRWKNQFVVPFNTAAFNSRAETSSKMLEVIQFWDAQIAKHQPPCLAAQRVHLAAIDAYHAAPGGADSEEKTQMEQTEKDAEADCAPVIEVRGFREDAVKGIDADFLAEAALILKSAAVASLNAGDKLERALALVRADVQSKGGFRLSNVFTVTLHRWTVSDKPGRWIVTRLHEE